MTYLDPIEPLIAKTLTSVILAALLAGPPNSMAAQTDSRLDALFGRLQTIQSTDEAAVVTSLIWAIWHQSSDEKVNDLMEEGLAAMSRQDYAAAAKIFSEMVVVDPEFAEGWNKRATVYYLLGDFKASVEDIERTLELEPRHFGALSGLGLIMMALNNEEAAIQAFEATVAVNPFAAGAQENIRRLKERQNRRTF